MKGSSQLISFLAQRGYSSVDVGGQENVRQKKEMIGSKDKYIWKICLTGGPCAGKTTTLSWLMHKFEGQGVKVFCVPEAATLLGLGGALIDTRKYSLENRVKFQSTILKIQMQLEDTFQDIAQISSHRKCLILCDRGVLDGKAYVSTKIWQTLLDENEWTDVQLRDRRYDSVIHLVTAADGATEFYGNKDNKSRYEDIDQAIKIDRSLQKAWTGHPNLIIVDNRTSFELKLNYIYKYICNFLGEPAPSQKLQKYLIKVDGFPKLPEAVFSDQSKMEITFLKSKKDEQRLLIKRGSLYTYSYYTLTIEYQKDQQIQKRNRLTPKQYMQLLEEKMENKKTLMKIRWSFVYGNQYMKLESYLNLNRQLTILKIEDYVGSESDIKLPPFLEIVEEVTNNPKYTNFSLAEDVVSQKEVKTTYEDPFVTLQEEMENETA